MPTTISKVAVHV